MYRQAIEAPDRMAPTAISVTAFVLALVGVLLGSVMQRVLPEDQLTSGSKEVIKLSIGVVATLTALVLGFLVASAECLVLAWRATLTRFSSIDADAEWGPQLLGRYARHARVARTIARSLSRAKVAP